MTQRSNRIIPVAARSPTEARAPVAQAAGAHHTMATRIIREFLRVMLRHKCQERGYAAEVARLTAVEPSMITMLVKGERRVGEHLAGDLARLWGIDLTELEQSIASLLQPDENPILTAALDLCRREMPRRFLARYEAQARRRTRSRTGLAWLLDIMAEYADWLANATRPASRGDKATVNKKERRRKRVRAKDEPSGVYEKDEDESSSQQRGGRRSSETA